MAFADVEKEAQQIQAEAHSNDLFIEVSPYTQLLTGTSDVHRNKELRQPSDASEKKHLTIAAMKGRTIGDRRLK